MDTAFEIAMVVCFGGGAVALLKLAEAIEKLSAEVTVALLTLAKGHADVAEAHKELAKELGRLSDRAGEGLEKHFHSVR